MNEPRADDALDREIERLIAVVHSSEFHARVRERIASEPAPGRWIAGARWIPAAAALAAAAGVAAMLWTAAPPLPAVRPVPVSDSTVRSMVEPLRDPGPDPMPASPEPLSTESRRHEPEVLLSADEAHGLRLLRASLREGWMPPVSEVEQASAEMPAPTWLAIEPVVITPIAQIAQTEGERQ